VATSAFSKNSYGYGGLAVYCASWMAVRDRIHADDDQVTGTVRAVLCFTCNGGLGRFRDSPEVLRRAAAYLEGHVWTPIPVEAVDSRLPS